MRRLSIGKPAPWRDPFYLLQNTRIYRVWYTRYTLSDKKSTLLSFFLQAICYKQRK